MPIAVITGLPGAGKTLRMVQRLEETAAEQAKLPEDQRRPIVVIGVKGLKPGPWQQMEDGAKWEEAPDNAIIFVDEAWIWFGHLHDASRKGAPPHVLALATHRHRGIDFVWTTQSVAQIYPFARTLGAEHEHVVRRFGTPACDVYKWGEWQDDVKSQATRDRALKFMWLHPPKVFDSYQSATLHTIQPKIPKRLLLIPACFVVGVGLLWWAATALRPASMTATLTGQESPPEAAQGPHAGLPASGPFADPADELAAYLARFVPRVAGKPWTAPAYDRLGDGEPPDLACMSSSDSCTCITIQQGTRYAVGDATCRIIARDGQWNPHRRPPPAAAPTKAEPVAQTETKRRPSRGSGKARVGESYEPPPG